MSSLRLCLQVTFLSISFAMTYDPFCSKKLKKFNLCVCFLLQSNAIIFPITHYTICMLR
jgi:hypothetical protein